MESSMVARSPYEFDYKRIFIEYNNIVISAADKILCSSN